MLHTTAVLHGFLSLPAQHPFRSPATGTSSSPRAERTVLLPPELESLLSTTFTPSATWLLASDLTFLLLWAAPVPLRIPLSPHLHSYLPHEGPKGAATAQRTLFILTIRTKQMGSVTDHRLGSCRQDREYHTPTGWGLQRNRGLTALKYSDKLRSSWMNQHQQIQCKF